MRPTRPEEPGEGKPIRHPLGAVLLLAGTCVIAYLPCVNNGFIADDFVILDRLDSLSRDFFYLFQAPPECFRLTSYLSFGILRLLFGYHAPWYYAFTVTVHIINSVLVWALLGRVTRSPRIGYLAAIFFASIQGHQEAVMWLAAMNEVLLGFCLLAALFLWARGRFALASAAFIAGLFSKESALMLAGLAPLLEWRLKSPVRFHRGHAWLLIISVAFTALFLRFAAGNFMLGTGAYSLSFHAVLVLVSSMHRLMFPWIYIAVILLFVQRQFRGAAQSSAWGLAFAAIALLPYIFLTYQTHVPSRQEYVASIGIGWTLAVLTMGLNRALLRGAFIAAFVVVNIGYIWIKDRQFELRAAPTTQLVAEMRARAPQDVILVDFPANPWIAKDAARMVPGWRPELIHAEGSPSACPSCLTLQWDPKENHYREGRK